MQTSKDCQLSQITCDALKGVGPQIMARLQKIGVVNVQGILFHLPLRYQDRTQVRDIKSLSPGESALIEGELIAKQMPKGGKTRLLLQLSDDSGFLHCRFFHVAYQQMQALKPGMRLRCFGECRLGPKGLEMMHPEYRLLQPGQNLPLPDALTPFYPTTDGLHQALWRRLTDQALSLMFRDQGLNILPQAISEQFEFNDIRDALLYVHRPPVDANQYLLIEGKHPAQKRLSFEELLAHRLSLLKARQKEQRHQAPQFDNLHLQQKLIAQLPYQLTAAQQCVLQEINEDIAKPHPMLRLLQGDVGSGKTVIAALSALPVIANGYQVAVMAPTEILAEQHLQNFSCWLTPHGIAIIYLAGSLKTAAKRQALQAIAEQSPAVVIGTHALFQEKVTFANLGLMIVDEQHRFGVEQRLKLKNKSKSLHPHQLTMTATPIPRTLAMTAYADLSQSIIDELPPGRKPVKTVVVGEHKRDEVISRVEQQCLQGRQAYWVCTLIEESEVLQCQAAEITAQQLRDELPNLTIGLVHGRIKADEKEKIMQQFKQGDIDLLLATTVIEVGVDVPNASLMVIENPERLGLSQLHQLRGRVGRGQAQSFCVLLYHQPLSRQSQERLQIMRDFSDGFTVAEKDLELRGPGEMLGIRQSGIMSFRLADIVRDRDMIPQVQQLADSLLQQHGEVSQRLVERWLGNKVHYRQV